MGGIGERAARDDERLFEGVLAGFDGVGHDVGEDEPSGAGREFVAVLDAVGLKGGVALEVVVEAEHEAVVGGARDDGQAEGAEGARGGVEEAAGERGGSGGDAIETGVGSDLKQYTVLPSLLIDYNWSEDWSFEAEIGAQWTSSSQAGVRTRDTELLATIGLRYTFHVDSNTRSSAASDKRLSTPAAAALCRYSSARPDGGSCPSPVLGSQ